ncbi:hypothetical protein ACWGQ2_09390 [Arthrobacter sp. NPDC055585]
MAARLSRLLTATTVILLVALLAVLIVDGLSAADLSQWSTLMLSALAVLVLIRLLTRAGSWRSQIAGPLAGSASVQSRMFGFTPGSSPIEPSSGPAYTISELDDEENSRPNPDRESN